MIDSTLMMVEEQSIILKQQIQDNDRYRTLIENSPFGVALIEDEHFTFVNSSFSKMVGYEEKKLIRFKPADIRKLIYYRDRDNVWGIIRNSLVCEKSISSLRTRIIRGNREMRWFELTINVINTVDGPVIQLIAIDVTEKKKLEEQLLHAQKMELMGQLTAGVAHQLSTPLAVISSRLQILEDDLKKAGYIQFLPNLNKVLESSDKISTIITRLVTFLRQAENNKDMVDINNLLKELTSLIQSSARKKNIIVEHKLYHNLPVIPVYRNKLEQVFMNIILNAFDAMPDGGSVNISTKFVKHYNSYIEVCFSDSGTGMINKVKDNIFEPFFTTKPAGKGSGLGMFISYSFIKEHNGDIVVESSKGKGTQVKVYLPVED